MGVPASIPHITWGDQSRDLWCWVSTPGLLANFIWFWKKPGRCSRGRWTILPGILGGMSMGHCLHPSPGKSLGVQPTVSKDPPGCLHFAAAHTAAAVSSKENNAKDHTDKVWQQHRIWINCVLRAVGGVEGMLNEDALCICMYIQGCQP